MSLSVAVGSYRPPFDGPPGLGVKAFAVRILPPGIAVTALLCNECICAHIPLDLQSG